MSSTNTVVIIIGVTSSLGQTLLQMIGTNTVNVVALVREKDRSPLEKETLEKIRERFLVIQYRDTEKDLTTQLSNLRALFRETCNVKILWLTPNMYENVLWASQEFGENLVIGSGSVIDWKQKKIDITTLAQDTSTLAFAKYVEDKVRIDGIAHNMIHPGFFLPDTKFTPLTGGLHLETCLKIFNTEFDPSYNWGKAKFVTPMSLLCFVIIQWIRDGAIRKGSCGFGSLKAYPRWELREMAGFNDVPESVKRKYPTSYQVEYPTNVIDAEFVFGCNNVHVDVEDTCKKARAFIEKQE
jgi:hypothetical protein